MIAEGLPVASCDRGYFIIRTRSEAEAYAQSLKGRLISDATRRRDFKVASSRYLMPARQERMF